MKFIYNKKNYKYTCSKNDTFTSTLVKVLKLQQV